MATPPDQVSDAREFSRSANAWRPYLSRLGRGSTGVYMQGMANFCSDRRSDLSACDAIHQHKLSRSRV